LTLLCAVVFKSKFYDIFIGALQVYIWYDMIWQLRHCV